jgi:hypothetical protein
VVVASRSRGSVIGLSAVVVTAAAIAAFFAGAVRPLGRNIPGPDIEADYLIGLVLACVFTAIIAFLPIRAEERKALLTIWIAKCVVALGVMLFYEWNYPLDAYAYFGFAVLWTNPAGPPHLSLGSGSDNVTYLASLIGSIAPSYHAIKLTFAMIGFVGVYVTYRAAVLFMQREDVRVLYLLGFFPSIIFWSSILGKDPLQLLGVAVYTYGVARWLRRRGVLAAVLIAAGAGVAASIRLWSGPILLFPLVAIVWTDEAPAILRATFLAVIVAMLALAWTKFSDQYRVETLEDFLSTAENVSHSWGGGGSSINNAIEFDSPSAVAAYAPVGMFTALFRPLPGEILNPFGTLSGLENLVLLLLAVRAGLKWRLVPWKSPAVRWATLLILCWALVYAFIAFNLGSIVRFKLQIYPVFLLLLVYMATRSAKAEPYPNL